jgi:hypothetical protein
MAGEAVEIDVVWSGPYAWPTYESETNLPSIPKQPGVYLQTFEYQGGYLIGGAGITRRPVPDRFREHTLHYMNGDYTVLDVDAIQRGIRKEIWHGWGYAREHREEFEERKSTILQAVRKHLAALRVFVAEVDIKSRIPERIEAAIMNNLYQQPSPFCDIPDKGVFLSPRRESESPIVIKNNCTVVLHGLPSRLEI